MKIHVVNDTPYNDHSLEELVISSFEKYFPGHYYVWFGKEPYLIRDYRWHVTITLEQTGCIRVKITDTLTNHTCTKVNYYVTDENVIDYTERVMFKTSQLLEYILKEFRDYYESITEPTYRYCKYDIEAVNQAVEVYNNKKTISDCAESIINKCSEKYTINLFLRISLEVYSEDNDYVGPLREQITYHESNRMLFDKLEKILNERGWHAKISYRKCHLKGLKRLVIDRFNIIIYDNLGTMRYKTTQDFICDATTSIYLLLRKCHTEYFNNVMEEDKNKRAIEAINNIYGYKKEENIMPPKTYFNYNNFDHIVPPQRVKDQSRHRMIQTMEILLGIKDVKFNDPATIVFWDDGTKTVVKCQKGDKFDPEKGLAMAIVKKQCGHNNGYFNEIFKKWCPDVEEVEDIDIPKRPKVFTETAEEYKEEVKKQKKIGDGYDDIRWEVNKRGRK